MEQPTQPTAPHAAQQPLEVKPPNPGAPQAAPDAPAAPRDPNAPKPKQFTIKPPIGDKPGFIWVANEDGVGGLGRVYMVRMRFGREVERIRMTKHYKKNSAKQVRDELDPLIGDLLYNEREHGALTEQTVRDVIAKVARKLAGPPRRPGPPRGGPRGPGGPRPGPGGPPGAPGAPGATPDRPQRAPGPLPATPTNPQRDHMGPGPRGPLGPNAGPTRKKYPGTPNLPNRGPNASPPRPQQPPPYEP